MITRRQFVAAAACASLTTTCRAAPVTPSRLGVIIHSYGIRSRQERDKAFDDPLRFLEFCHAREAGSVQLPLGQHDSAWCERLRDRAAALQMSVEGAIRTPLKEADVARFEAEVLTAQQAGARVLRTVMLGGRRYEVFERLEEYREFERGARKSLELARPILERHRVRLAIENHKDYRAGDLADLLRSLGSEYIGCCVDTGNNIALLEDPLEVVKTLAPWAFACHLKDMGVREYPEGFLLAEVPLGTGFLDLKQIVSVLRTAHPELRLHLEMMTRDPLRIPCLTPRYWATFDHVPAQQLASALTMVRRHAGEKDLPKISALPPAEQLAIEDRNVRECLAYAQTSLA